MGIGYLDYLADVFLKEYSFGLFLEDLGDETVAVVEERTLSGDLVWEDEKSRSGVVLFSAVDEQENIRLTISRLDTGQPEIIVTRLDDESSCSGLFLKGACLDSLIKAIEEQLAEK